jgi:hypothetical protein
MNNANSSLNKQKDRSHETTCKHSPIISHAQPQPQSDVFAMLNQHLGSQESTFYLEKRAKKASEGGESYIEVSHPKVNSRGDIILDTASSNHEEESASLGKRSVSEFCELKICGKRNQISPYLDSVCELERALEKLHWLDSTSSQSPCDVEKTAEVHSVLIKDFPRQTAHPFLSS